MKKLGLIGYPLGHSFSKKYYLEKFQIENIQEVDYDLYSIEQIEQFPALYSQDKSFYGFNVTIPHKQAVITYLDELTAEAEDMNAVNCIQIRHKNGKPYLKGFNTDAFGFEHSLSPLLQTQHTRALILGNGGAAKAVIFTLKKLGIQYQIVSRHSDTGDLTYQDITKEIVADHKLIINCSPVGTAPNIEASPDIPYDGIGSTHLLYDLIYNPAETTFLRNGREKGATTKNGYEMLILQAEKNWEIWNEGLV